MARYAAAAAVARLGWLTSAVSLPPAQAGDFYGGWITSDIEGPFKGEPGTLGARASQPSVGVSRRACAGRPASRLTRYPPPPLPPPSVVLLPCRLVIRSSGGVGGFAVRGSPTESTGDEISSPLSLSQKVKYFFTSASLQPGPFCSLCPLKSKTVTAPRDSTTCSLVGKILFARPTNCFTGQALPQQRGTRGVLTRDARRWMASWGRRRAAELGGRAGKAGGGAMDGADQELGQALAGEGESKGAEAQVDPRFWLALGVAYTCLGEERLGCVKC